MITRRAAGLLAAGAGSAVAARGLARADTSWMPSRPLRLVVAYPAGGATDAIARIVAHQITGPLGQNVIVENVAGASGALGTRQVARGEPDGHTFTFGNNQSHGTNMLLMRSPGYDAVRDFAALAGAGAFENVLVVRNSLPVDTAAAFVAHARAEAVPLTFASTGPGSGSHLSAELLMVRAGFKATHIPYRGLAALAQDLVAGRIDFCCAPLASIVAQVTAGQVRALAMQSARRHPMIPDIPTLSEQGIVDADLASWAGFFAPARAPRSAIARLSRDIIAALRRPEVATAIAGLGFTVEVSDGPAFAARQVGDLARLATLVGDIGLKPDD